MLKYTCAPSVKFIAKRPVRVPIRPREPSLSTSSCSHCRYFNFFFLIFHKQRAHFVLYLLSLLLLPPPVSFHDAPGCFSPSAVTHTSGIRYRTMQVQNLASGKVQRVIESTCENNCNVRDFLHIYALKVFHTPATNIHCYCCYSVIIICVLNFALIC